MIDSSLTLQDGHLSMFVVDAERELVRFACRFCGATTEPIDAGQGLPESFPGVPHEPSCLVVARVRGQHMGVAA